MSFANAWGSAWGASGSGASETIIVDSFGLEVSMEEVVFEEAPEYEISLNCDDYILNGEETVLTAEEQEYLLEILLEEE
jgi:hypothetical protein